MSGWKERDAGSYDAAAAAYDRHIERLAGPLADAVCDLAGLGSGDRVLDVGCGSGVLTRRAVARVRPSGQVIGVDLSAGMLAVAAARDPDAVTIGSLQLERMDAEQLELDDASFDAVVSMCAILHFPDAPRAVREMRRVLRPGGRLVVTFGSSRPRRPLDVAVHGGRSIARALTPWRAELRGPRRLTELAEASLPEPVEPAVAEWADAGSVTPRLRAALRDAGLVDIRASWFGREEPYETADELWEAQTTMVTPVRKRIAAAPADLVEELHRRFLTEANAVLARGGRLVYPYGTLALSASAPSGA